jgi:hypothetical protein
LTEPEDGNVDVRRDSVLRWLETPLLLIVLI